MSSKYTTSIAGATLLLIIFSIIGKGIGFIREVLIAKYFGAGAEYEIYLVAAVLPITINTVVFYISQNYFLPQYYKFKQSSAGSGYLFTSGIFWLSILVFILFSLLLYIGSEWIIGYYLGNVSNELFNLSRWIFILLLISLPLNAGFSILTGYLNAEFKYTYPAASQIIAGIIQILSILILYGEIGIYAIPAGLLAAYLVQLLYLLFYSRKFISFRLKIANLNFFRRTEFGSILILTTIIELLNQLYVITDRYFYDMVEEGGIAALYYGSTIFQLPLAIISGGLSTVIFPKISEAFSKKEYPRMKSYYGKSILYNILIYIPIVAALYIFGEIIIKIAFERGKFSNYNTVQTFQVLQIYLFSLLFYSTFAIINKMIFSMHLVKQLLVISIISLIIKVVLNALLVSDYQQYGLAAATSAAFIFLSLSGFFIVQKKLNFYNQV